MKLWEMIGLMFCSGVGGFTAGPSVLKQQDNKGPFLRQDNRRYLCPGIAGAEEYEIVATCSNMAAFKCSC